MFIENNNDNLLNSFKILPNSSKSLKIPTNLLKFLQLLQHSKSKLQFKNMYFLATPIFPEILFELQIKMTIISFFKDSITFVKKKQKLL